MSEQRSEKLRERLADLGFTPGVRDVPELIGQWRELANSCPADVHRKITKLMVQALGRADRPVASKLLSDLRQVAPAERALRVRVVSRIAARIEVPELEQALGQALTDGDPRVVRSALRAIGKLAGSTGEHFEDDVVKLFHHAALPERRAAAEALGKIGGPVAAHALAESKTSDDELARRCAKAIELIERRARRSRVTDILTDVPLAKPTAVLLRCRAGSERFARDQACAVLNIREKDTKLDPLGVVLSFAGALNELHQVRIALDATLAFELAAGADLTERVLSTLSQPQLVESLRRWSDGPLRFRLSFSDGSARRGTVRAIASALSASRAPLHNDSREAPWSIEVDLEHERLLCVPRVSGRHFDSQLARIPAASHPTLAALMAWVARPQANEVVWDPFCGSGSELIECALLEPSVRLYGTDRSDVALDAARRNLAAAGITARSLVQSDSLQAIPREGATPITPSLIITNPPMGRRVSSSYTVHELLQRFARRAAELLPPGGRLVWVTPAASVSADAGHAAGLHVTDHGPIDLAGMRVHLQIFAWPRSI